MPWYDEHVEYGEGVLRPYLKEPGLDVHKVLSQIEDGKLPQEVVQQNHDVHQFVDGLGGASDAPLDAEPSSEGSVSDLTVEHVEAAIDFARDNQSQVQRIIDEQEQLTDIVLQPAEDAHEAIQQTEFRFFEVDSTLSYENGEPVLEFDYN